MTRRHDYAAEGALRSAVRACPAEVEGHVRLGAFLSRSGRLAQAREALQDGLKRADRTAPVAHCLGLVLAGAGDFEGAERHLARAAALEPNTFIYLRDLALVRGAAGKTAESVEPLRRAVALAGEAAPGLAVMLKVGEKALAEQGIRPPRRPPAARERSRVIEELVVRDPGLAEAFLPRKGEAPADRRDTLRSVRRALKRLASEHPSYADLHFGLSLVAEQLGEIDRAIAAAEKALEINPRYAEAALLAVRLYEASGRAEEAADRCRRVTELRPEWVDAHLRLGGLLGRQGRRAEAASAYRRALEIAPACDVARRGLETVAARAGGEGGTP